MADFISDFIVKYFFTGGYNLVNTITYGLVLGYIVFRLIPRLKPLIGRIDLGFVMMLVPFILYGSTMREMIDQDMGIYAGHLQYPANWFFVSPGIYFTMFALTMACIILGLAVQRAWGVSHRSTVAVMGWALFFYNLTLLLPNIKYPQTLWAVLGFFAIASALVFALKELFHLRFLDFEGNLAIVLVHMFDASTTFVGVDLLGHFEKHVIPTFFINMFHTAAVMYPLKFIVLVPALYMIDDEMRDDEFGRRFVKFVILVLGAGPAIRNMALLLMG